MVFSLALYLEATHFSSCVLHSSWPRLSEKGEFLPTYLQWQARRISTTDFLLLTTGIDPRDISNLMSRAGFNLLTVDVDEIIIRYPSMWELLDDLRDMGENNAIIGRCACSFNRPMQQLIVGFKPSFAT
jgi:hypothetical protein